MYAMQRERKTECLCESISCVYRCISNAVGRREKEGENQGTDWRLRGVGILIRAPATAAKRRLPDTDFVGGF